jgi:hypothetical protein
MLAKLRAMEHETDKIQVISLADDWEVEFQSGVPLAHEDEKCDAIDTVKGFAQAARYRNSDSSPWRRRDRENSRHPDRKDHRAR